MITKIRELISGVTRNEQDVIINGLQSEISRLNATIERAEKGYYQMVRSCEKCDKQNEELETLLAKADAQIYDFKKSKRKRNAQNKALQSRLDQIASLETPSANGTSKKMAKIARGEL